jgi:ABC transport system ATP-binding/permease protein
LVFEGAGRVNEYVGGYSDWLRQRRAMSAAASRGPQSPSPVFPQAPSLAAPPGVRAATKGRRLSYKEQRELEGMPDKIQGLEAEQLTLTASVADPDWYKRDPAQAAAALQRLQSLSSELELAYARWDALEAQS